MGGKAKGTATLADEILILEAGIALLRPAEGV